MNNINNNNNNKTNNNSKGECASLYEFVSVCEFVCA